MIKIIDEYTDLKISAHKKWKLRHPARQLQSERERHRRYVDKNHARALLKNVRWRAKAKGLEFNLTEEDVVIPDVCPVLGTPLVHNRVKGHCSNSPSIDRVDNDRGYVKGNVRVISWRANSIKRDATMKELEQVLNYVKKEYVLRAD